MKKLKLYLFLGFIFTSVVGCLAHFFYDWSGQNVIVGLFTPINESTWEHLKLLFFPALLWSLLIYKLLKQKFPKILCNLFIGILAGTFAIPIIFYLYTGILGFNILLLDIGTFILSVAITFLTAYCQAVSLNSHKYSCLVAYIGVLVIMLSFFIVTFVTL